VAGRTRSTSRQMTSFSQTLAAPMRTPYEIHRVASRSRYGTRVPTSPGKRRGPHRASSRKLRLQTASSRRRSMCASTLRLMRCRALSIDLT
jgi:hypothetical protein